MTRTQNSALNIITSVGANLLTIVLNFATRSFFISALGVSFLGVEGYFSNILSMLSLTELGFGTAIGYYLYKPIAEDDRPRLRALIKLYHQVYHVIGFIIIGLGLCLIPFLPMMVKDYAKFAELGLNAVVVFLLYLFNSACSYLFFAANYSFVSANQKGYLLNLVDYIVKTAASVSMILVLVFTKNFMIYLLVQIGFGIISNLCYYFVCNYRYPYLKEKTADCISREERKSIFKDCYALMLHRINGVVIDASDNIVLTAVWGLDATGLYSNYLAIKCAIRTVLSLVIDSLTPSIGNLKNANNDEWNWLIWRVANFASFMLCGIVSIGVAVLINDFITIWPAVGSDFVVTQWTGANGVVYQTPLGLLVGMELFFYCQARVCGVFRVSFGIFQPLRYRPIASILVNLAVTIITTPYWGMSGCVLGTIASLLFTELVVDPLVIHKYVFHRSPKAYYLRNLVYTATAALAWAVCVFVCRKVALAGVLGFIVHGFLCVFISAGIFILFFFRTDEFRYVIDNIVLPVWRKFVKPERG